MPIIIRDCIYKSAIFMDRQTDRYSIDRKKIITDLFVKEMKGIYVHVNLLKSYDNIHDMTYTTKIMLSGIAKIKTRYFDNINDHYLKRKKKRHCQGNIEIYHFVSRTKTRYKVATMYEISIIYSSKKDTLESVET